jgi:O-acetyl-ADP-ribose deacetylase (regulator of RNase III)
MINIVQIALGKTIAAPQCCHSAHGVWIAGVNMLKHVKGNLLDLAEAGEFDVVVQGCNCFCRMGSGIAREIRERYPRAWNVDMLTNEGDYTKLGNWTDADAGKFWIINAYTQYDTAKAPGEDVFEYSAFALILQKLEHTYGDKRIGLPYIGMGLAGGKKEVIIPMIEYFANSVAAKGGSVTLVEFG